MAPQEIAETLVAMAKIEPFETADEDPEAAEARDKKPNIATGLPAVQFLAAPSRLRIVDWFRFASATRAELEQHDAPGRRSEQRYS